MPVRSLEGLCGRAALLARKVEGNAGAGLSLGLHRGMAYHPGKDQRRSMKRQVTMPHRRNDRRIRGAASRKSETLVAEEGPQQASSS